MGKGAWRVVDYALTVRIGDVDLPDAVLSAEIVLVRRDLLVPVLIIFGKIGYLSLSIRTAEVRTQPSVL